MEMALDVWWGGNSRQEEGKEREGSWCAGSGQSQKVSPSRLSDLPTLNCLTPARPEYMEPLLAKELGLECLGAWQAA